MTDPIDFDFDADDRTFDALLSPPGLIRRAEILKMSRAAARRKRNRRTVTRGVVIVLAVCVVGLSMMVRMQRLHHAGEIAGTEPRSDMQPIVARTLDVAPSVAAVRITWIKSEPGISQRLAVPAQAVAWKSLTDSELMDTLASAGKPVGLIYVDNQPALMLADVILR